MDQEYSHIRFRRKEAVAMDEIVSRYIKSMKIAAGLNTQRIFAAWDACSDAAPYTLSRFFRDGVLTVKLNSSIVRDTLYFQRDLILKKMNDWLAEDELFPDDNRTVGFVKEIVLR